MLSVSATVDRPEVGDCERGGEDRGGGAISSWGSFGIFADPEEASSRNRVMYYLDVLRQHWALIRSDVLARQHWAFYALPPGGRP